MKRDSFIKHLTKKKYLFTDTGDNIIIHGVDPSKRLNSIQTYGEIDLSSLSSLPRGVIFEDTVDIIRIPNMSIANIPDNTIFLNSGEILLIDLGEYGGKWLSSSFKSDLDLMIDGISPGKLLTNMVKGLGKR